MIGSRGAPVIIGTSTSNSGRAMVTVPAPYVPEELISQAQVVLQGKSRNLIIRELQVSARNGRSFNIPNKKNCVNYDGSYI